MKDKENQLNFKFPPLPKNFHISTVIINVFHASHLLFVLFELGFPVPLQ